jgi:hypothetical protein
MKTPKIDWLRAGAEFIVIVVGVLVALGVDSWNQAREDHATEQEYLLRLERDVQRDIELQEFILTSLSEKSEALELISATINADQPAPDETGLFVRALAKDGNNFGWGFPLLQSVTFDDLTDTGNLRLLRDTEVRDSIIGYYKNGNHRLNRIARRHTDYPRLVTQILPPEVISSFPQTDPRAPGGLAREREVSSLPEPDMSPSDLSVLLRRVRQDDFRDALNSERNFAFFAKTQITENLDHASDLFRFLQKKREGG